MRLRDALAWTLVFICVSIYQSDCYASEAQSRAAVRSALAKAEAWLDGSPHAETWNTYLHTDELRALSAADAAVNRAAVGTIVDLYKSNVPGIESPRFVAVRQALIKWYTDLSITPTAELPALIDLTKDSFAPVGTDELAASRGRLRKAVAELDRYLGSAPNGQRWRLFLRWKELGEESAPIATADQSRVEKILDRFESGWRGLEMAPFARVERALRDYWAKVAVSTDAESKAHYAARLSRLGEILKAAAGAPGGETPDETGLILGWLDDRKQAADIFYAVRGNLSYPNLFVRVSDGLLGSALSEATNEDTPIHQNIEGTQIDGTGHTVGTLTVSVAPSADRAMLQAVFRGTTNARTFGRNGPARLRARSVTELEGHTQLFLEPEHFYALPAVASGKTKTSIDAIYSAVGGVRGCIVERVAPRRAAQGKSSSERIASRKAARMLEERLDSRIKKRLDEGTAQFWDKFRRPLIEKNQYPEFVQLSTTPDELDAVALLANRYQLAAPSVPPVDNGPADVAVRVHESAINNTAAGMLAGVTLESEDVRKRAKDLFGKLPESFEEEEGKEPWSITFADEKPLEVHFRDGTIQVTIRGKQYTSGDKNYRAMNVTANYRIESTPEGPVAVRQGDLEIFPPGFVPGQRRLSVAEQTLRNMLERRMGKMLTDRIGGKAFTLPGKADKVGELAATRLATERGWLVLALLRTGGHAAQPVASAQSPTAGHRETKRFE